MVKLTEGPGQGGNVKTTTEVNKAGDHASLNQQQINAKAVAAKARDYPKFPSSNTGGVMPMNIESKFWRERQRLSEDFTDKWRQWRVRWIKDQTLHPIEPRHPKEMERALYNPIRRAIRAPWNWVELKLASIVGPSKATVIRRSTTSVITIYCITFWLYYLAKYRQRSWEDSSRTGWLHIVAGREGVYPGDPAYPSVGYKFAKHEFYDMGFSQRNALKFEEPSESK